MNKTMTCQLSALLIFTFLGTSAFAQSKPASDWKAVVEAAKREGMVKCACPPRREFASLSRKVSKTRIPGLPSKSPRRPCRHFLSELPRSKAAKMFLWDVYTFGPGAEIFDLKTRAAWSPCGII